MTNIYQDLIKKIIRRANEHIFKTQDSHQLTFLEFGGGPVGLFIFPGMAEPAVKYWELAEDFASEGYHVFVLDHLGHGFSDHLLPPQESKKVHMDHFSTYIQHGIAWVKSLCKEHHLQSHFLLGHSMGGLIASAVSLQTEPSRLVLSSPMFGIHTKGIPHKLAVLTATLLPSTSWAPFQEPINSTDLAKNRVTQSQERADFLDQLFRHFPSIERTGVTNGWLRTSLVFSYDFFANSNSQPFPPSLIFQAGRDSFVVINKPSQFAKHHNNCQLVNVDDAKHEILMERDDLRSPVIAAIKKFLKEKRSPQ